MPRETDANPASDTTPATAADDTADDNALRKRLLSHIAVAGVVILGLLGGLAVFEVLNKPQAPALPKMAAAPIDPPAVAEPAKPLEVAREEPEEESKETVVPEPERTETVLESPQSVKSAKPLTLPATPHAASIKPPPPVVTPAKPDLRQEIAKAIPERPSVASSPPAAKPLAQAAESARRFLVQVGVFSNPANAEELVTKLQAAGIPVHVETRVQVGPFASRAEVDAARAKLRAMGIDDGLLVKR